LKARLKKGGNSEVLFDPFQYQVVPKVYPSEEEQDSMESHKLKESSFFSTTILIFTRIWKEVIKGIKENNEDYAFLFKRKLEERQRREEKERDDSKTEWIPKYFVKPKTTTDQWLYKDFSKIREEIQKKI